MSQELDQIAAGFKAIGESVGVAMQEMAERGTKFALAYMEALRKARAED